MNKLLKIALSTTSLVGLCLMALVVQAGSWDNFKLRYFHLTAYLHNQDQEITDLQKQNLNLAKSTRINLTELLNGGPPTKRARGLPL
ncbi:hypothetical protein [Moorena sp. SIO1G6]|uniref:hypothetical protein n=1 Tax=Moorena sp. SIO1G6 TaxID=2607840 RepID=UPI00257FC85F|nr:hypothetical protein [Moorena sp. SIO1G6]